MSATMTTAYAPIDVHFDEHAKYADFGLEEMGLIACAITRANRTLSDGRISRHWPERRFGRAARKVVQTLLEEGVWKVREDGDYEIVGYLEHNRSRAEVESIRAKYQELGRRGGLSSVAVKRSANRGAWPDGKPDANRAANRGAQPHAQANAQAGAQAQTETETQTKGGSFQDRSVCSDPPEAGFELGNETPSETRIIGEKPRNATDDGAFGGAIGSWAEGIRSVTGKMFLSPPGGSNELAKLVIAITKSCPDMGKRIEWAREHGAAFARDAIADGTPLNAHRFVDWLNTPRQSVQNASGPTIAPAMTPEERMKQVAREEAERDEEMARRLEGAGGPPEPLSVMMARLRSGQGQR